ncbi:hypothetical protein SAICODRAFT_31952 [Saitoella complicata NRRL Y-17804]|uniref:uncharacterized protein n=1 Tax=Saitoella complicata (strain BCRC 22490 / CBS 7301 / JCM 7358 / NBRC 10748 / NRRL Y-17804) TaxID=698492 RepID=UPI000867AAE9|nr:uncharacterized protein SAICODRAFT_31952 [Saitoella complicata NRRL Y-17804]ODQ50409.1 hypothetical protein SAICODRAFT_31952 [Saitoella complicata NRRL Y-17804]
MLPTLLSADMVHLFSQGTPAPNLMRGSSPLMGPAADDLDGFLEFVREHSPAYTNFDIHVARQGVIDNGLRLEDLKRCPRKDIGVIKMGSLITMQEFWPRWKTAQQNMHAWKRTLEPPVFKAAGD